MRQRVPSILVLLLALFVPRMGVAWSLAEFNEDRTNVLLGALGGILVHELGHISMATLKDADFEFDGLSIVYPDPDLSDADRVHLASAGFQFQWLASELAFHYLSRRDSRKSVINRAAGVVLSHLAITGAYVTFLKHHTDGDIEGMANATGVSHDKLALAVAVPAILDGWRLLGRRVPKWVPILSPLAKGAGVTWAWAY